MLHFHKDQNIIPITSKQGKQLHVKLKVGNKHINS